MNYNVGEEFFIIGENNKIEKYNITGYYTHTSLSEETQEEVIKTYYVYQKGEIIMTIGENHMYKTLEEVKTKIFEMLDKNILDNENLRKEILEYNL